MPCRLTIFALPLLLAGCALGPSYPEPQPDSGQILVHLRGVAREGVTGPATRESRDDYNVFRESVEKGSAFERVDYGAIEEVIVVLKPVAPEFTGPVNQATLPELTLTQDGFDSTQVASRGLPGPGGSRASLVLRNERATAVTIYGFSADDLGFEAVVPANSSAVATVSTAGVFDVFCLEDEQATCRWITEFRGSVWQGVSWHGAFFGGLPAGKYELEVYPPRLPIRHASATVELGKRTEVTVDLTMNDLPKARR